MATKRYWELTDGWGEKTRLQAATPEKARERAEKAIQDNGSFCDGATVQCWLVEVDENGKAIAKGRWIVLASRYDEDGEVLEE